VHNYGKKLIEMGLYSDRPELKGVVSGPRIAHDERCGIYRGDWCNCDPEFTLTPKISVQQLPSDLEESARPFAPNAAPGRTFLS
jgi:hypothetical protein